MILTLDAPLSIARYTFDKALANRGEGYFSPSLGMNWKPDNRMTFGIRGGIGRAPMNLRLIHPGVVMTDYRSFSVGVDDFYSTASQNVSATFACKYPRRGIFASAMMMQSWSHMPYTMVRRLLGAYVV